MSIKQCDYCGSDHSYDERPLVVNPERIFDISGLTEDEIDYHCNVEAFVMRGGLETDEDPGNTDGLYVGSYYDDGQWCGPDIDGVCLIYVREKRLD